jgi:hypothetical protein
MSSNSSFPNPNSLSRPTTSLDSKLSSLIAFGWNFSSFSTVCTAGETYMDRNLENVALARQYLKALESGPIGDELAKLFAPEVVLEIFSSKFFPNGSRDDLAGIFAAAERGKKVMTSQKYEIRNEVATGDKVALEVDWTGTLALSKPFQKGAKCGPTSQHFSISRTAKSFPSATTIATSRSRPSPPAATAFIDPTAWPPFSSPPSDPRPLPRSSPDTFGHTTGLSPL